MGMGIKKELMFFTRSFRMWGVILAAVVFACLYPPMMKLADSAVSSYSDNYAYDDDYYDYDDDYYGDDYSDKETVAFRADSDVKSADTIDDLLGVDDLLEGSVFGMLSMMSVLSDMTATLILIFMLVTMYTAGGELKKRSMIIPQNAGLSPKLYLAPKFLLYPPFMLIIAFLGIMLGWGMTTAFFGSFCPLSTALCAALAAGAYDMFLAAAYFTLGLCTAKAGLSVILVYGGHLIFTVLFDSFGADKFHPFTLVTQAQNLFAGEELDAVNLWGSIAVTLLLIILCYFVTLFVISTRKIDNSGEEQMEL